MAPRPMTLAEAAASNLKAQGVGSVKAVVRAAQVVAYIWALASTAQELEHFPSNAEYAAKWGITERTATRENARAREAFPGHEPEQIVTEIILPAIAMRQAQNAEQALALPAPSSLVYA